MKVMDTPVTHKDLDNLRSELITRVDDGFKGVMSEMRNMANMISAKFERVDTRLENLETGQQAIRKDISNILSHIDSIEKRLEITEDERVVLGHQIERTYEWLKQLADKAGIELKP